MAVDWNPALYEMFCREQTTKQLQSYCKAGYAIDPDYAEKIIRN